MFAFDLDALDLRRGLVGTVGVLAAVAFIGILGPPGMLGGMAAVLLGVLDQPGDLGARLASRLRFLAVGTAVVGLLAWSSSTTWSAVLVATAITFLGTLMAAWGPRAGAEGASLVLVTVVTLMVGTTDLSALELAAGFMAGGLISTAIWLLGRRWTDETEPTDDARPPEVAPEPSPTFWAALRSPVGLFAVLRGFAVGIATLAGYQFFEDHRVWAMLTVVVVLHPPARQTVSVGIERTLGTFLGVIIGIWAIDLLGTSTGGVVVAFVVSAFAMISFQKVNYTLFTLFTTCVLLSSQRILQEDAFSTGWQRLGATLLGSAIALVVVAAVVLSHKQEEPQAVT